MAHEHALAAAQTCRAVETVPGREWGKLTKACFWSFSMGVSSRFGGMARDAALLRRKRVEGCTKPSRLVETWADDGAAWLDLLDWVWASPTLSTPTEPLPEPLPGFWFNWERVCPPLCAPATAPLTPLEGELILRSGLHEMPAMPTKVPRGVLGNDDESRRNTEQLAETRASEASAFPRKSSTTGQWARENGPGRAARRVRLDVLRQTPASAAERQSKSRPSGGQRANQKLCGDVGLP